MRLYKAGEMAKMLGLHEDTVYRLAREGKLEVERVGRSVRFYDPTEKREVRNDKRKTERASGLLMEGR